MNLRNEVPKKSLDSVNAAAEFHEIPVALV